MGVPLRRTDNGQPTLALHGVTDGRIGIGAYEVRPIDQAVGFSVFAAGGQLHQPYFVQKVLDGAGKVLYQHKDVHRQVLDPKVANDVTYAMKPIASWSNDPLAGGRPSAAKTGTQQFGKTEDNSDAWMVGFTPQISAAVWVGTDKLSPIRNAADRPIYGAGLPGQTWRAFLDRWLADKPVQPLPGQVQVHPQALQQPQPTGPATETSRPRPTTTPPHTTTPPRTREPVPTTTAAPPTATPSPTPEPTLPLPTLPTATSGPPAASRSPRPTP
jgi:membrane peptidoglycan carboxypeptidase